MKALIVEDNDSMRFILKHLLEISCPAITHIKDCDSAEKALGLLSDFKPDLLLTDLSLAEMDGIELTRHAIRHYRQLIVYIVTCHDLKQYERYAHAAGAKGIYPKDEMKLLMNTIKESLSTNTQSS
ncbi:MAG: response regulator transcription factor [Chitinispirillaceae bacterium]